MSSDIKTMTKDGKITGTYYHSSNSSVVSAYFYNKDNEENTLPVHVSGKRKGHLAFKKDETLIISDELFAAMRDLKGEMRNGFRCVKVYYQNLQIYINTPVFYDYRLIEILKQSIESSIRHIHSLEHLEEQYNEKVVKWNKLQVKNEVSIKVEQGGCYKHLTIENVYCNNCWEYDRIITMLSIPLGESTYTFGKRIGQLKSLPHSYALTFDEDKFFFTRIKNNE